MSIDPSITADTFEDAVPLLKVHFFEQEKPVQSFALTSEYDAEALFGLNGQGGIALRPPYDIRVLSKMVEYSNCLRQNIDAYATNIDSFGYHLEPLIHLETVDATHEISEYLSNVYGPEPPAEVVEEKRQDLRSEMLREERRLKYFFKYIAGARHSFVHLRMRIRQDLECTGNAYVEVMRKENGEPVRFLRMPVETVFLCKPDPPVDYICRQRVSLFEYDSILESRRFQRFVQVVHGKNVFYKEFGDPRFLSRKTGRFYETLEALKRADATDDAANEIIHFKIPAPRSDYYGVPRWIGVILEVAGNRMAAEVNYLYFGNKSIPPMAILVSGGRFTADTVERLRSYIENKFKGTTNFHKVLILEAEGAVDQRIENPERYANTGRVKIEMKPLTEAQTQDSLFRNYTQDNVDLVGQAFRLPRLLRGDIRDFNRSTAGSALNFAEMQVFQPIRNEFDDTVNWVLDEMGIKYWRFVSNAPIVRDPMEMSKIISTLMQCGALVPKDGRALAGDVFNKQFPHIKADWMLQPLILTQQGVPIQQDAIAGASTPQAMAETEYDPAATATNQPFTHTGIEQPSKEDGVPDVVEVPASEWQGWGIRPL